MISLSSVRSLSITVFSRWQSVSSRVCPESCGEQQHSHWIERERWSCYCCWEVSPIQALWSWCKQENISCWQAHWNGNMIRFHFWILETFWCIGRQCLSQSQNMVSVIKFLLDNLFHEIFSFLSWCFVLLKRMIQTYLPLFYLTGFCDLRWKVKLTVFFFFSFPGYIRSNIRWKATSWNCKNRSFRVQIKVWWWHSSSSSQWESVNVCACLHLVQYGPTFWSITVVCKLWQEGWPCSLCCW